MNGSQICDKKRLYWTKNRLFGSHSTDEEITFKTLRSKTLNKLGYRNKLQITCVLSFLDTIIRLNNYW